MIGSWVNEVNMFGTVCVFALGSLFCLGFLFRAWIGPRAAIDNLGCLVFFCLFPVVG